VLKRLERGITSPNERYGDGRNTIEMILRTDSSQRRPDRNAHGGQFQHPWNNRSSVSKENTLHGEPVGSSTSSTYPVPGERFIASSRNMDFLSESKPNRNRPANGSSVTMLTACGREIPSSSVPEGSKRSISPDSLTVVPATA